MDSTDTPERLEESLRELVAIPSWYQPKEDINEARILEKIEEDLDEAECRLWRMPTGEDGRWNLIAEKGSGSDFTLYVYVHVDTVWPTGNDACRLEIENGIGYGLGAGDIKSGVAILKDILVHEEVGPNVRLVACFLCDEEYESLGARTLVKHIHLSSSQQPEVPPEQAEFVANHRLPRPDLVAGIEIPTVLANSSLDHTMTPVVFGRNGHLKSKLIMSGQPGHAGYGSLGIPDIYLEIADSLRKSILRRTKHQSQSSFDIPGPLPTESLQQRNITTNDTDAHSLIHFMEVRWSHIITPPASIKSTLERQQQVADFISVQQQFTKKGIQLAIEQLQDKTSYEPYSTDLHSKEAQIIASAVNEGYREHNRQATAVFGGSTSDANIFHAAGYPTFEFGPEVRGEHTAEEQVELWSLLPVRRSVVELLSGRHFSAKDTIATLPESPGHLEQNLDNRSPSVLRNPEHMQNVAQVLEDLIRLDTTVLDQPLQRAKNLPLLLELERCETVEDLERKLREYAVTLFLKDTLGWSEEEHFLTILRDYRSIARRATKKWLRNPYNDFRSCIASELAAEGPCPLEEEGLEEWARDHVVIRRENRHAELNRRQLENLFSKKIEYAKALDPKARKIDDPYHATALAERHQRLNRSRSIIEAALAQAEGDDTKIIELGGQFVNLGGFLKPYTKELIAKRIQDPLWVIYEAGGSKYIDRKNKTPFLYAADAQIYLAEDHPDAPLPFILPSELPKDGTYAYQNIIPRIQENHARAACMEDISAEDDMARTGLAALARHHAFQNILHQVNPHRETPIRYVVAEIVVCRAVKKPDGEIITLDIPLSNLASERIHRGSHRYPAYPIGNRYDEHIPIEYEGETYHIVVDWKVYCHDLALYTGKPIVTT